MGTQLLNEQACYERLRDWIIDGTLQPNERLIELDLVARLGVGRATIRTVLARLEQEGLVVREPNRGARVRFVSPEEALEILEARTAIESLLARFAALRAQPDELAQMRGLLAQMRACIEQGDLVSYSALNTALHRAIADAARHRTAARLLETLGSQSVRYQYRTILAPGRPATSLAEHTAVVEAIAAHDPDAAEQAMRAHLSGVCETFRRLKSGL
ncbi:GntR family transcriptional regulator [Thermogemmatispora sp.]|uniref:GntR family transcriptional regulator n=1 Tax=Thermogemmatispora sp. TaxID=1968838 RepID=UPI001E033FDC|nr:GntR family transcriptional regulator [Thermogemmatispora sp.]MBX5450094.1 GntR family transcriptional regulator [Thermogemmatispora sp.]